MAMTPPAMPPGLTRAHAWARSQPWLGRFTLMNRLLLAMAFIPTGLVKATGQRFTTIPVSNPVGFFFEAMYQTGPYWHFIGLCQIVAGVLLLIPATATLGALLFLPIALSIFLITWGVGFSGTVWVTAGMLLSVLYLIAWDGDRVWAAFFGVVGRRAGPPLLQGTNAIERTGWVLGGLAGFLLLMITRSFISSRWTGTLLLAGAAAALLVVLGWVVGLVRHRD